MRIWALIFRLLILGWLQHLTPIKATGYSALGLPILGMAKGYAEMLLQVLKDYRLVRYLARRR